MHAYIFHNHLSGIGGLVPIPGSTGHEGGDTRDGMQHLKTLIQLIAYIWT